MVKLVKSTGYFFGSIRLKTYLFSAVIGLAVAGGSSVSIAKTTNNSLMVSLNILGKSSNPVQEPKFGASHYTWGAAELSLTRTDYAITKRVAAVEEVYWFSVNVCDKPMLIGVSASSGELMHTYQIAK